MPRGAQALHVNERQANGKPDRLRVTLCSSRAHNLYGAHALKHVDCIATEC
jgi:hypothetical protein